MVFYVVPMVPKAALVNIGQLVVGDGDDCGTIRDDGRGMVYQDGRGSNPNAAHHPAMIHK